MTRLPRIPPLTLTQRRKPFDHLDWVFELNHDGFRGVAYIQAEECRLVSRRGNIFKSFRPLCETLGKLPVKNAILDGELICLDGEGVSRPEKRHPITALRRPHRRLWDRFLPHDLREESGGDRSQA